MGVASCPLSRTEDPRGAQRVLKDIVLDFPGHVHSPAQPWQSRAEDVASPQARAGWLPRVRKALLPCHHSIPCLSQRWQACLLRGHTEWTKDLRGGVGLESHWLRPPQRPEHMLHTEGPKNQNPLPRPDAGRAGSPCTSHLWIIPGWLILCFQKCEITWWTENDPSSSLSSLPVTIHLTGVGWPVSPCTSSHASKARPHWGYFSPSVAVNQPLNMHLFY